MPLDLKMVSLGEFGRDGAFPEVRCVDLKVADLGTASKRCLAHIADRGLPRDRWAGGVVTDEAGNELGQVSYSGVVFAMRPMSRDKYVPVLVPEGLSSSWSVDGFRNQHIHVGMPGFGTLSLQSRLDIAGRGTFSLESQEGFHVDGRPARLDAKVVIDGRGVSVDAERSELEWVEDNRFEGVDAALAETIACTLREWLSHDVNADLLVEHAGKRALFEIDEPLSDLGQGDHRFERSRREVLAVALAYASLKDAVDDLPTAGLRP